MTMPTQTPEAFPQGILSAREIRHLVDEHNQGVIDDHVIAAKLDTDGTVSDTNYEAQLTASELDYEGYTPTEAAVTGDLGPFTDPGQRLSEELVENLVSEIARRVNDQATIAAKLDGDAGVPSTVYGRAAGQVPHLVRRISDNDSVTALGKTESGDLLLGTTPTGGAGDPQVRMSRDGGRTWTLLNAFGDHSGVAFVFEGERGVLFAGLNDGSQAVLYKSHDYGTTWEAVSTSAFDGYATFGGALVVSEGVYYVGGGETDAPVFKSTDAGESWTQLTTLSPNAETEVQVLLEAPDGSIVAGAGGGAEVTIHRSTDGGGTWTLENTNTDHDALLAGIVTGAGTLLLVGTAEGTIANQVFRSTDDGATWATNPTGPTAAAQASIAIGRSGRIYVGGDTGVHLHFSDDDGATFSAVAFDLLGANETQIEEAITSPGGSVLLGTTNATDGAGIHHLPDFEPQPIEALNSAVAGEGPLFPGPGGGIAGDIQQHALDLHNHLTVVWHSLCAILDSDSLGDANYEAQLSVTRISQAARTGSPRPEIEPIGG